MSCAGQMHDRAHHRRPGSGWSSSGVDCRGRWPQHPVIGDDRRILWLDLAYPEHRVGVEHDGGEHLRPDQVRKDVARHARLVAAGRRVFRYTAHEIRHERDRLVADVAAALGLDPTALRLR